MIPNLARAFIIATTAALCGGCLDVPSAYAAEKITVSRAHWFLICTGVCPSYTVTVSADGEVTAENHWTNRAERFRATVPEANRFRSILRQYRPTVSQQAEPTCHHDVPPQLAGSVLKVLEIEIVWSGPPRPSRLVACDSTGSALNEALRQALWSGGLYVDGTRRRN